MPARRNTRPIAFDHIRFVRDLKRLARERRMAYTNIALVVGFDLSSLTRYQQGVVPDGTTLAALCKWGGLNAADYSLDVLDVEEAKKLIPCKDKQAETADARKALEVA